MKEVSTKVLVLLWKALEKRGVSAAQICEEAGIPLAKATNTKERIDWAEHSAIMLALRNHVSEAEMIEIGRSYLRAPPLRFAMVIARLALSPMDFYRWFSKPREGVGNQMFSCIKPSHRELAPYDIELDLTLPDGYEVSREFLLISQGNVEEMPVLLGYPRAKVTLTMLPNGGRFRIAVPQGTAIIRRMWRFVMKPFVRRDAAKELRAAHESLLDRYEELESAQMKLDRQAAQLRAAHSVNVLVQRDIDVDSTLATVAKALVEEAGFAWAEVKLIGHGDNSANFGTHSAEPVIERVLEARGGEKVASLAVTSKPGADLAEREALLEFITPSLAIALQNATYRSGLERLVDERTAELKQAHDQLAGTVVQLRDAQSARERFFGNISHEIRTPLSLIMLAAADIQARAGGSLDERGRQNLISVNDAARKLVRLVDELLLLAAGQEGKFKIHREPTDLAALVRQLLAAWRPATEAAGLELFAAVPDSLLESVDPVAIERVASNLVSNAIKYTPRGGRIDLELAVEGDKVRLSVLDTGPGIDDDLAKRLFGRFERGSADRQKLGTGIGLSLVKQLVEGHDGHIDVHKRTPHGTEIRVTLPHSTVKEAAAPIRNLALQVDSKAIGIVDGQRFDPPGISLGTIVIAEDNAGLAEATARLLADRYTVYVGLDGESAAELVKQHQPQLLITDIDMPKMNGIELAQRFRELTGDKLAPIIMLSAVIDLGTRVAGLEAGAIDYVTKPFDSRELVARVDAQFRMRELAVRLHQAEQLSTLGILTSGLAHELRNPANGIVNAIGPIKDLLPSDLTGPDTGVGQLLDVMNGCADQIGFLSRQLLNFRAGGMQLELRSTKITEIVTRSIGLVSALEDLELRNRVVTDVTVSCSAPLIIQALTNLLENAAHAAGPQGWVEVSAQVEGGRVSVEVADSGPGVPVALRERIFEPFFTTKAPGVGTGLGLPVARAVLQRHGGVLEVRERLGRTVFVIELPLESVAETKRARYDSRALTA